MTILTRERILEIMAGCEGVTPGPYEWWTSNSWRRLRSRSRDVSKPVIEPYVCRDGQPDLIITPDDMQHFARLGPATVKALCEMALASGAGSAFRIGDRVRKTKGSSWQGHVVGFYRTKLTSDGIAVESERELGSVQIYPASALERVDAHAAKER